MLELHKIIRVSHVVACPIVVILFYDRDGKRGVFKVMKNDQFVVFLAVLVLFHKSLGRLRSSFYQNCMK